MKFNYLFIAAILLLFTGCIKNDIPYPVLKGVIQEIEFSGQESVEIDALNMVVNVVLSSTTDITNVSLTKFTTSEKTTTTPAIELPMIVDLSADYKIVLRTYQDYVWTIKSTQNITRTAKVNMQVGKATFDAVNRTVIIWVASQADISKIQVKNITFASPDNSTVSPTPESVTDFTNPVVFTVTQYGRTEKWTATIKKADYNVLTNSPAEVWAKRAVLNGGYMLMNNENEMNGVGFEYKMGSETTYTKIAGVTLNDGEATYTLVTEPSTTYHYRITQGEYVGKEVSFTTEAAPSIPNIALQDWCEITKSNNKKVWFPCLESEWGSKDDYRGYWSSGNDGVVVAGRSSNVYPVMENGKRVACLETIGDVLFVGLAAGNLFVGNFVTEVLDPLASTRFGRTFTGRPTKLIGKYKYLPKTIDVVSKNHPEMEKYRGQMDRCIMWMNLEDWDGATVRPKNPTVIARAEYRELGTVGEYKDFELVLDYKDKKTTPTHLCMVFSASEFGDFFTGGAGTKLFISDLQLVY